MNAPLTIALPARSAQSLPSPAELQQRQPLSSALQRQIHSQREAIRATLDGRDPRLLVIIGPCYLHDADSDMEYGQRLAELQHELQDQLLLVMRAYIEKPRTTVGWKGLLYDPHLDGSGDIQAGLELSRSLLLRLAELGLPLAGELLQPMAVPYFEDLLGWGAIGARTSESQVHRELVSGLALPVGFKNATDGSLDIACDAMQSARQPHHLLGLGQDGRPALLQTRGNADGHVILRGGRSGPNYQTTEVLQARTALEKRGLPARIVVDCSHANSGKDAELQPKVLRAVVEQRLRGDDSLRGVMLESHLIGGCQPLQQPLRYGQSITDACLGWEASASALSEVAERLRQGFR